MKRKWLALGLCAALILGVLSGCKTADSAGREEDTTQIADLNAGSSGYEAGTRTPADIDLTNAAAISLAGASAQIDGEGASVSEGVITIYAAGTYVFSGSLTEGRVLVDAKDADVILVLNGADINCSYGSPLFIYQSASTTLHIMEGTENTLTDGESYTFADAYSSAADEEPNACLYSKSDLVIQGAGALTVNANYDNGVTSKDTLEIYDLLLTVHAVNNGINGKDSNLIDSASITVVCGGDAVRSTNDTDTTLGWVRISNSILDLTAGEDGVQAETCLTMSNGSYTITSGGGSGIQPSGETSAKGIKAGSRLTLTGGDYTLDCSDDAVHSNEDVTVSGGVYTISSGDDAFHADEALVVSDGEIEVLSSYEGLEGSTVELSGGTIRIVASDDGVNAAGGADGSGFGGFGPGNAFGGASADSYIQISGGYLYIKAGGDGLDSNGNITMTGGTVIATSTGRDDGALDYDGAFTLTGGTLLAADSGMMPQTPSEASQYTVYVGFDRTLSAESYVSLASSGQEFVFELPVDATSLVFSSPDLKEGTTYTVSYGGEYSGETAGGICSGGSYSGGTELAELTLTEYITVYSTRGADDMDGGMGGRPDGDIAEPPDGTTGNGPGGGMGNPPDGDIGGGRGGPDGTMEGRSSGAMSGKPEVGAQEIP